MTQQDFTAQQVALYLGLSRRSITYYTTHPDPAHRLVPDYRIGRSYMFTRATLDAFQRNMRHAGQPRKERGE